MSTESFSRRTFLTASCASLSLALIPESRLDAKGKRTSAYRYPNPGKIVIEHHAQATNGFNKVNEAAVQAMFDAAIMRLTGITTSPADALQSLFPQITKNSRIAIKPNLINGSVPTRKEVVKALLVRLSQMLGGFPAQNITIYDRHSFSSNGYTTQYFGAPVKFVSDSTFPDFGQYIFCDGKNRPYSRTLFESDFLINMPVLKDHSCPMDFTLAFKNHMGTVNPGGTLGICSNDKATIDIMADPIMVQKQKLVILDALYAVYNGGPGGSPQAAPNKLMLSQDPVTIDYQGRKLLNELRAGKGLSVKKGAYIERAAAAPYTIGVANPAEMRVDQHSLTSVHDSAHPPSHWTLSESYPNPFTTATSFTLELTAQSDIHIDVQDEIGRRIETIVARTLDPGAHHFEWSPQSVRSGIYSLVASVDRETVTRKLICIR